MVSQSSSVLITGDGPSINKVLHILLNAGGFTVEEARGLTPRAGIVKVTVRDMDDWAPRIEPQEFQAGALAMDLRRRILWRSGARIHLSPKEYDLLAFMMQNQGVPLSHAQLLRSVWGPEYGIEVEYLRTYVRWLRKKIEANPARPDYILTEPWIGYRFRDPNSE